MTTKLPFTSRHPMFLLPHPFTASFLPSGHCHDSCPFSHCSLSSFLPLSFLSFPLPSIVKINTPLHQTAVHPNFLTLFHCTAVPVYFLLSSSPLMLLFPHTTKIFSNYRSYPVSVHSAGCQFSIPLLVEMQPKELNVRYVSEVKWVRLIGSGQLKPKVLLD